MRKGWSERMVLLGWLSVAASCADWLLFYWSLLSAYTCGMSPAPVLYTVKYYSATGLLFPAGGEVCSLEEQDFLDKVWKGGGGQGEGETEHGRKESLRAWGKKGEWEKRSEREREREREREQKRVDGWVLHTYKPIPHINPTVCCWVFSPLDSQVLSPSAELKRRQLLHLTWGWGSTLACRLQPACAISGGGKQGWATLSEAYERKHS